VAELYRRYWRAARAAAYGITADFALAEDAASEAFCAALAGLGDLRDPQRFGPWLHTIVVRTARRLAAARSRENKAEKQRSAGAKTHPPSDSAEQRELAALLREAVDRLPDILREAVCLFYFEGYNIDEAALFLDVPAGTFKRRLHDARQRLRDTAQQILEGRRPMSPERDAVLQQLRNYLDQGGDAEAFCGVLRQAYSLRPPPLELIHKILKQHWGRARSQLEQDNEKERWFREMMARWYGPSERAQDPNHPVGAVARAIQAALPEFELWQVDAATATESILKDTHEPLPPGFAQGKAVSYVRPTRGIVLLRPDGSMLTQPELLRSKPNGGSAAPKVEDQEMRISDVLDLTWMRPEAIELRSVEELLRRLVEAVLPGTPARFGSHEDPRCRCALRLELGDVLLPGAVGGVHYPWPGSPPETSTAHARIFLETWATVRSGQTIELVEFSLSPPLTQ